VIVDIYRGDEQNPNGSKLFGDAAIESGAYVACRYG